MKRAIIPIIITLAVAVSSCGPSRKIKTSSRAPGIAFEVINIGAYNNDPGADKARTAFNKANQSIVELNRLKTYNLEEAELAILQGATITTAELNRLAGVTSAIQTQINGRLRTVDSTGNAAGSYVTRKALRDSIAVRDTLIALKANSDSPTFTTTATLPANLTIGSASITGTESYSTENYGSTGTGNIVLSIGPTLTTVNITDVIKLTPTASPPSGATEGMIYADTDHHLYYYNGSTWVSMTD